MKRFQVLLFAAVLASCVGCDHATKWVAQSAIEGARISLVGDAVRFEVAQNTGAFLNLGSDLAPELRTALLLVATPSVLAIACFLGLRSGVFAGRSLFGLGLLAGGGFGNWLDRLMHGGAVTDFVSLGVGPLRTGIFNLADVCIVAGAALLVFARRGGQRSGQVGADSL